MEKQNSKYDGCQRLNRVICCADGSAESGQAHIPQTMGKSSAYQTDIQNRKLHPSIRYRMPNEGAILSMVESGFGYAIIPQTDDLKNYQVDISSLPSGSYSQRISLTTLKGQNCCGASLKFTEYLKNQRI